MTGVSEDDDVEFIYIVAGAVVGVLVVLTLVICIVLYVKRTSSSVFGVYNPKTQEQTQGQQMNTALPLPVPEKLIWIISSIEVVAVKFPEEKNNLCNDGCVFTDIYQTLCEILLVLVPLDFIGFLIFS